MDIFSCFLALLASSGVFIAGINMMSEGLEKSAGKGTKALLSKISNRFTGVGIGALVTAIIQSSGATSVVAIGFVNIGVMTLEQAASIILGANIGTTVTGLIAMMSALPVSAFFSAFAFVGIMMTFASSDKTKQIGRVLCGFGLLFIGLSAMSDAFNNDEIAAAFSSVFEAIKFPPLLILCGILFTALLQSSSAMIGMLIVMVGGGVLPMESALFVVLGANIGTCSTALLAAIGSTINAKRTAGFHLLTKVLAVAIATVFIWPFAPSVVTLLAKAFPNPEMQIAMFHVFFNIASTVLLFPFIGQLVKLIVKLIPDKKKEEEKLQLRFVDEHLFKTPTVAVSQAKKELIYMAQLAKENMDRAFAELQNRSGKYADEIVATEARIDFTNHELTRYLIRLSPLVDARDEQAVGSYFHVLNDIERIGDHAENFLEMSRQMKDEDLSFSEAAMKELDQMYEPIREMFRLSIQAFETGNRQNLTELSALEESIDDWKNLLSARHFDRLSSGNCRVELSAYFTSVVSGMERVADHLINVGYSIVNPTGSQKED